MTTDPSPGTTVRFSNTVVSVSVADRVRNTVRGMQAAADRDFTLRRFVELAFIGLCQQLETAYNGGKPWPHINGPLDPGRPRKESAKKLER